MAAELPCKQTAKSEKDLLDLQGGPKK